MLPVSFGEHVNTGDMVAVQCAVVKGDQPVRIRWTVDGADLQSGDGVEVSKLGSKISALTIDSVQPDHRGRYTCTAENAAGVDSQSADLNVLGVFVCSSVRRAACRSAVE